MADNRSDRPVARPRMSAEQFQAASNARIEALQKSLNGLARSEHGTLAELSRIASLATARLDQAAGEQGKAEYHLAAVKAMLQEIENAGHQAYLAKHGTEEDYQAIGSKVEKRYRTLSGKRRP